MPVIKEHPIFPELDDSTQAAQHHGPRIYLGQAVSPYHLAELGSHALWGGTLSNFAASIIGRPTAPRRTAHAQGKHQHKNAERGEVVAAGSKATASLLAVVSGIQAPSTL